MFCSLQSAVYSMLHPIWQMVALIWTHIAKIVKILKGDSANLQLDFTADDPPITVFKIDNIMGPDHQKFTFL